MQKLELGCGLIGIGQKWGVVESPLPTEEQALQFLDTALALGIQFYDTAPAYALSEQRLGIWLSQLTEEERGSITVSTKCGEHWNFETDQPYKDYSVEALQASIRQSLRLLGAIDVLQIHGVTPAVLASSLGAIKAAFAYAQEHGIKKLGMSISDPKAFALALEHEEVQVLQIQHNTLHPYSAEEIQRASDHGVQLLLNRPFGMGQLAQQGEAEKIAAYQFLAETVPSGVVLTGTKSPTHLRENVHLFERALQNR